MKRIIFLHGFKASAKHSQKVRILKNKYPQHIYIAEELEIEPQQAIEQINTLIQQNGKEQIPHTVLIGSSLGGFYAYYLSLKWKTHCLLINPSLEPYKTLREFIGPQESFFTGRKFEWKEEYLNQLKDMATTIQNTHPKNPYLYRVVLGTQDERLDYTKAQQEFKDSVVKVYPTNHRFQKLEEALQEKAISNIFE